MPNRSTIALFSTLELSERAEEEVADYQGKKGHRREAIDALDRESEQLKERRKQTPHHIADKDPPESDRLSRPLTERKHFVDTVKLIAYRGETSMAPVLREKRSRRDDARSLLRRIYNTEADLIPGLAAKTLTVRPHSLTAASHDAAARHLCDELNATGTIFPDTELRLVYQLEASQFP